MPFTPTHVIAALPLWSLRRHVPWSAAAIGSMTPDTPLFVPVVDYAATHSTIGSLTTCLPIGVATFLLWRHVLRVPPLERLPDPVRRRIDRVPPAKRRRPPVQAAVRLFAVAAGHRVAIGGMIVLSAWTHQTWDAFTHQGRQGVAQVTTLEQDHPILGTPLPEY